MKQVIILVMLLTSAAYAQQTIVKSQISQLVQAAAEQRSCEEVTIYINCFGVESCKEVNRQKDESIKPFAAAGLSIPAVKNYWKKVIGYSQAGTFGPLEYDRKTSNIAAEKARLRFSDDRALRCLQSLGVAINLSAHSGPEAPTFMIPLVEESGHRSASYIIYSWANRSLLNGNH